MFGEIKTASGKTVKMNSRAGRSLPDVDVYQDRLWTGAQTLIDQLDRHVISPDGYIDGIRALHHSLDMPKELAPWIERLRPEQREALSQPQKLCAPAEAACRRALAEWAGRLSLPA